VSFITRGPAKAIIAPGSAISMSPRDAKQAKLPEGFQTSEFLMKKGLIDRIVERKNLRGELSLLLKYFSGAKGAAVKKNGRKVSQS